MTVTGTASAGGHQPTGAAPSTTCRTCGETVSTPFCTACGSQVVPTPPPPPIPLQPSRASVPLVGPTDTAPRIPRVEAPLPSPRADADDAPPPADATAVIPVTVVPVAVIPAGSSTPVRVPGGARRAERPSRLPAALRPGGLVPAGLPDAARRAAAELRQIDVRRAAGLLPARLETAALVPGRVLARLSPGGRRGVLVAGAAALALLLVLGSVSGYGWLRDRGMRNALATSAAATDRVLGGLAEATSLGEVAAAAGGAAEGLAAIEEAVAEAGTSRAPFARQAYRALEDQAAVLEAVQPLSSLSTDSFNAWGTVLPAWHDAEAALDSSLERLGSADPDARVPATDLAEARTNTVKVVGKVAADALRGDLDGFVSELATVGNTTGAASLGQRSTKAAAAAEAAAEGQSGDRRKTLGSLGAAFTALGGLARMEPESLHVWEGARGDFTAASAEVGVDTATAVASMDAWVADAESQMAAWRTAYAQAEAARSSATGQLDSYATSVRDVLRRYAQARDSLSDVVLDTSRSSYDVEAALNEGYALRSGLRDEVNAATVPSGLIGQHAAFGSLLERSLSAVGQGQSAVWEWNQCWGSCPDSFRDLPQWAAFNSESAQISTDFEAARKDWESVLEDSLATADATPLPPVPDL